MFISQLNKLKSGIKNGTEGTLNLSSNVIDKSNDETNFPHRFLLTNTQVSRLRKAFANNSSANYIGQQNFMTKMLLGNGDMFLG